MARGFSQRVRRQRVEWRWTCASGGLFSRREAGPPPGARKEFLEKRFAGFCYFSAESFLQALVPVRRETALRDGPLRVEGS